MCYTGRQFRCAPLPPVSLIVGQDKSILGLLPYSQRKTKKDKQQKHFGQTLAIVFWFVALPSVKVLAANSIQESGTKITSKIGQVSFAWQSTPSK
jgi:hypothetical protein